MVIFCELNAQILRQQNHTEQYLVLD